MHPIIMNLNTLIRTTASIALACIAITAQAATFDILVGSSSGRLTSGYYLHGSAPPAGGFSVDHLTGENLFPANFGDFAGGASKTNDPGFQGFAGAISPGALLYVRGVGSLQYWSPATPVWTAAPSASVLRLDGGVPTDIATAYLFCQIGDDFLCNPTLASQFGQYEAGTRFTGAGIAGPNPAIVDEASPSGSFHAHLDWSMENQNGTAASIHGAYLVTLRLASPSYQDSAPLKILFNYGLSSTEFQQAYDSRVMAPVPEVPTYALLAAGLGLITMLRRRRHPPS
jgi:MYXO-CTERM domain-containing protein